MIVIFRYWSVCICNAYCTIILKNFSKKKRIVQFSSLRKLQWLKCTILSVHQVKLITKIQTENEKCERRSRRMLSVKTYSMTLLLAFPFSIFYTFVIFLFLLLTLSFNYWLPRPPHTIYYTNTRKHSSLITSFYHNKRK